MFINNIIWESSHVYGYDVKIKSMTQHENYIFYYGYNNIINKIEVDYPIEKFNKKDEYGYYYESYGGGRNSLNVLNHKKIIKNNKVVGVKYYAHEKKKKIGNIWTDIKMVKPSYPTEKPYRLMERIICLSTI